MEFFRSSSSPKANLIVYARNYLIVAFKTIWSPYLSILELRKNNKPISDTKFDMYERAMTYEDELYSQPCIHLLPPSISTNSIEPNPRTAAFQLRRNSACKNWLISHSTSQKLPLIVYKSAA